ncbi:MAG TPA: hypothetical protein VHM90_19335 [Phycisphaerae bacterium]|nr:hypothetical protein [Phycisphaerae bacterium]
MGRNLAFALGSYALVALALQFAAQSAYGQGGGSSGGGPPKVEYDKVLDATTARLSVACVAGGGGGADPDLVMKRLFKCELFTTFSGKTPGQTPDQFLLTVTFAADGKQASTLSFTIDGETITVPIATRIDVPGKHVLIALVPRTLVEAMADANDCRMKADGFVCGVLTRGAMATQFVALLEATSKGPESVDAKQDPKR